MPPSIMLVFPGQGSHYRGMGEDLVRAFPVAQALYDRASGALGYDLAELSFRDPREQLDLTRYTQPALLTHSIACFEVLRELTGGDLEPAIVAGHSLGEYSALVAAEALSFEDGLRLVSRRGDVMSRLGKGQMLAVPLGLDEVKRHAERHYCGIGGCNLPSQTVVGGLPKDLEALGEDLRREHPQVRPTMLRTEGAFHTYLMIDAAIEFRRDLEAATFAPPRCPVLSNYTGEFHDSDPDSIRHRLFFQLFNPVRWAWGYQRALEERVDLVIELGGGIGGDGPTGKRPNLAGILKRIAKARTGRYGRRSSDTHELDYEPLYGAAINEDSLRKSAHLVLAMLRLKQSSEAASPSSGVRSFRLCVPTVGGVPLSNATEVLQRMVALELSDSIDLVGEDAAASAALAAHYAPERARPAPYLEEVVSGESAAVLHYLGDEIDNRLLELRRELSQS